MENKHTRSVSLIDGHTEGMTDAEIIKALECCIDTSTVLACADCPLLDTRQCIGKPKTYVSNFIVEKGIDLINRHQAEIERLQKIIVGFMDEVGTWSNKYDVDISNIHKLPILAKEDYNIKNKIKSEAIKEFAKRLKKVMVATHKDINGYCHYRTEDCDIDNLAKEMTE